ncbi:hypothetical protein L9F63_011047 [Diploptera punctata]|uniref:Caspase-1 n=1 Tax=Diploptera punctata TaxID=6984 RepID=A0AAD8EQ18_DIPPU|nr:hypothetical protein L9F63_011047 [Diploptera punctata]
MTVDDDPFTPAESSPMEIPKNFKPRVRRVSDVIDSIGDVIQEMGDFPRPGTTPEKVPSSPLSSDYGSYGNGITSPWSGNLPLPITKTRVHVTDGATNTVDATPMDKDPDTTTREIVTGFQPVDRDAIEYNMNHKRRGKAVIFNHEEFDSRPFRDGSHHDVASLEKTYGNLGFEVVIYNNLDYQQIKVQINALAQEDHSDADCLIVTPFTADKCVSLAGKPKIFIIQACRGDKLDPGITLMERRGSRTETDSSVTSYRIPTHADFLISFSSVDGFYSWRNAVSGTWYIQSLCEELWKNAAITDLHKILTNTARRVALEHQSQDDVIPWYNGQKQVPCFHSMLIRDVYFRPKV